jgi:alkanesulfonate monooxygenase SsuD/methylene tetrahydromethanopterin reductase-like flavin-dependent oxidoreductase (luciferase family)
MSEAIDGLELDAGVGCGLVLTAEGREGALASARRAEALGFSSLWAADHLAFHVPVPDPVSLLGFAAAATERVLLGTAVDLLPLRAPVVTAKQFGSVSERGSRSDETIPLLRRLWSERDVVHEGRHFALGPVTLEPRPCQPAGPPIWVGGRAPAAMRRAGRLGDGYISHMASARRYRENLETIAAHAREAGRAGRKFASAAFLFTSLAPRFEDAHRAAAQALARVYARPFEDAARKYCLLGRPEDCLEQMRGFVRAGARHFILSPLGDAEGFAERIAAAVLPELPALIC